MVLVDVKLKLGLHPNDHKRQVVKFKILVIVNLRQLFISSSITTRAGHWAALGRIKDINWRRDQWVDSRYTGHYSPAQAEAFVGMIKRQTCNNLSTKTGSALDRAFTTPLCAVAACCCCC